MRWVSIAVLFLTAWSCGTSQGSRVKDRDESTPDADSMPYADSSEPVSDAGNGEPDVVLESDAGTTQAYDSGEPIDDEEDAGEPEHMPEDAGRSYPTSCERHSECAGHPAGEVCILFEQRCGECLFDSDCPSGMGCGAHFECGLTDSACASADRSRPFAENGHCVECRGDADCLGNWQCEDNACVQCETASDCDPFEGNYCVHGQCAECQTDSDCTDPDEPHCSSYGYCSGNAGCGVCPADRPLCDGERCVECLSDSRCDTEAGLHCHAGVCRPETLDCATESDCSNNTVLTECSSSGECVECTSNSDCRFALVLGGVCDTSAGRCVSCSVDSDCDWPLRSWDNTYVCIDRECVQCRDDSDCPDARRPYCTNHTCSSCSDARCRAASPTEPFCSPYYGECEECVTDADCGGGQRCMIEYGGNTCVDCIEDEDCGPNLFCSNHRCTSCDALEQCRVASANYVCGTYPNNCGGTLDCGECGSGGTCISGGTDCLCPADSADSTLEGNSAATSIDLGTFTDGPATSITRSDFSIHTDADEDWFTFDATDAAFRGGNPDIAISLDGGDSLDWSGYELTMWIECQNHDNDISGRSAIDDSSYGTGFMTDGSGELGLWASVNCNWTTNDSAHVTLRVRKTSRYGRCDSYELGVRVY